jgi:plastocyanin
MKKIILSLLLTTICLNGFSKTWTVLSSGMTFSPATVTINQGDSVKFTLDASHNAVEVSQTVWNANGATSNNGFSLPFGGGTALPSKLTVGTHYYVCTPHASLGMKGNIIVSAATALKETANDNSLMVYPNPISDRINIQLNLAESTVIEIKLFDLQGKLVTTLVPKTLMDGTFQQSFERVAEMSPGVYLVKTTLGNTFSYRKVIAL